MSVDTWSLIKTSFDAHSLGQHNSLFTVSNGYVGLKGNLHEDRDGYCPVTLINGVYDELDMFSLIRASSEPRRYLDERFFDSAGKSPAVANLPNPLAIRVFIDNKELSFTGGSISGFRQELSLRNGLYAYSYVHTDAQGRSTRIETSRLASIVHPHRVHLRYALTLLNHASEVRVHSGIDAATFSNTTREKQFQVTALDAGPGRTQAEVRTPARGIDVRMRTAELSRVPSPSSESAMVEHDAAWSVVAYAGRPGMRAEFERHVAIDCSEDARLGSPVDVGKELEEAVREGFAAALAAHDQAWQEIWERCDVLIDGDDEAQRDLRFSLYHVLAAAPRHSPHLSVPVKLLSGEYYQGNTFYDTDVYILPLYTFTCPDQARRCLQWRWIGLEPGRQAARRLGYPGTKLAWQAGPFGEECLGQWWRFTHTNIHINADVAYALMQYWQASGDDAFMAGPGVDLLVETARFFAGRSVYDAARDAYDLRDVAGPDEGHCESTNNFYTNCLAAWNLRWAAQVLAWLEDHNRDAWTDARQRLGIAADEPARWQHVAERLTLLFDAATGIYEQCEGFYQLEPLPPDLSPERKTWFATVAPYQALNQPDVLMAMVMLRDAFPESVRRANYRFYKDKSMNFSSMSFVINAIAAADLGDLDEAYRQFRICAGVDIDESLTGRRDTYAGLHGTAAGGAWMAAVFGFAGVRLFDGQLSIEPRLPSTWNTLSFKLTLYGGTLELTVGRSELRIQVGADVRSVVRASIRGQAVSLSPGQTWVG